jgi:Uncharacterized protein predicted to be involved in DNA repair (RAMP superfamily)
MTNWYTFNPVDTLFFRGAEPMVMGENHTTSQTFPPPAQTISGALRTAVLIQHKISFDDYGGNRDVAQDIVKAIGKAGEEAPFNILGPLFMKDHELYVPAPYCWFVQKDDLEGTKKEIEVYKSRPVRSSLFKTEFENMLWAKGEKGELVSVGGNWIKASDLHLKKEMIWIMGLGDFFGTEQRTGIALHKNRRVRDGHLYSFNHARLKEDVSLVFGVDKILPLADDGILTLGAEQRFGSYKKFTGISLGFDEHQKSFMSLSLIEGTEQANHAVIATGKIQYLGGWDLKRGFHKPMKGFFPAGSVFSEKINQNFIAI